MQRIRRNSKLITIPLLEVFLVTLATYLISFPFGIQRSSTIGLMNNLFEECLSTLPNSDCPTEWSSQLELAFILILIASVKAFCTIYTFGLPVPAGIFIPSMVVGACIGRAFGILVVMFHTIYPQLFIFSYCTGDSSETCINPGTFAIIGAVSTLCGVTRMTISLVVIVFELTGIGNLILPLMITVLMAKWTSRYFEPNSIYDALMEEAGYPYIPKDLVLAKNIAFNIMSPISVNSCLIIPGTDEITSYDSKKIYRLDKRAIFQLLDTFAYNGFPVLQNGKFCGYVLRSDIILEIKTSSEYLNFTNNQFLESNSVIIRNDFIRISSQMDVGICLELFKRVGCKYLFVVRKGELLGIVTRKDLYEREHKKSNP